MLSKIDSRVQKKQDCQSPATAFPPTPHPGFKVQPPTPSHGTDTSFGNGRIRKGPEPIEGNHPLTATAANEKKKGREVAVEADKNPTHPLKEIRMPNATRGASPPFPRIQVMRT